MGGGATEVDLATRRTWTSARLPDADAVWIAIAVVLPAIVALASSVIVIDLAYHLRAGENILASGSLQQPGPFSFAESSPWLDQQWGAQLLFALLFRVGGFAMLPFVRAVAIAAAGTLMYLSCRSRGADRRASSILTSSGTLIALPSLGVRPQLFGLVLFAVSLWIVCTRRSHPGRLWALPLLAVVWTNVHGSFIFLLPLLALAIAESWVEEGTPPRRLVGIAVLSALATLLNPYGASVWTYVLDLASSPIVRDWVTEWQPLTIRDAFGVVFFASLGATVLVCIRRAEVVTWVDLAWLATFAIVGLLARRSVAWWAFVAPVVLAGIVRRRRTHGSPGHPLANAGFLVAMALSVLVFLPWWRTTELAFAPDGLVAAVRRVTEPGDRIIVHQSYASWFEWRLPDRPVFVDSRIELYSEAVWKDYQAMRDARDDWAEIVDRWRADAIVADPEWAAIPFLRENPGWRLVFMDQEGLVFARA